MFTVLVSYFTDGYVEEREATMVTGKVGARKVMSIPLGDVIVKGKIDFSNALPKPEVRETSASPTPERRSKSGKPNSLHLVVLY